MPNLLTVSLGLSIASALAVLWIDLPLARFFYRTGSSRLIDRFLASSSPILIHAIPDLGLIVAVFVLAMRDSAKGLTLFLRALVSGACAYALTELVLKPLFGRTDPHDWLFHHHAAFRFFSPIGANTSFPSGHAALATGALLALALLQHRRQALPVVLIVLFNAAMVVLNVHFLGDVLAGSLVGYLVARLFALQAEWLMGRH